MNTRLLTYSLCLLACGCARGTAADADEMFTGEANAGNTGGASSGGQIMNGTGNPSLPGNSDNNGSAMNQTGGEDDPDAAVPDAPMCTPFAATCSAAVALGDLIGTQRTAVKGFPDAKKELEYRGKGSGFVKVHIVDEFDAFGDYDFDNLVGIKATFLGQPSASYEIRVTGGTTMACAEPYAGHVVKTDMGIADVSSVFARYTRIPPLTGSHVNDFGNMVVEVKQLSGDCTAPFVLKISGHPCSSNCAWNANNACNGNKEPRTCTEVTD